MAVFAATDFTVSVGGTDLTDHVNQVELSASAAELETTAFGDDWTTRIGGLKSGTVTIAFHQDFAASSVDATLWPLLGTTAEIILKPTSGAVSSTNPSFTFNVLVTEVQPISASVGDLAVQSVTWPVTDAVTRATS